MTTYHPDGDRIRMETSDGPAWLDEAMTNQLLDIYDNADAKGPFNALYQAGQAVGFIPRGVSFRERAA